MLNMKNIFDTVQLTRLKRAKLSVSISLEAYLSDTRTAGTTE